MSHRYTERNVWQPVYPDEQPSWQDAMELHAQLLKSVRDRVAFDYQQAGKDALAGHAADAMGELTDKLCDLVTEYEDSIESLAQEAGGGES